MKELDRLEQLVSKLDIEKRLNICEGLSKIILTNNKNDEYYYRNKKFLIRKFELSLLALHSVISSSKPWYNITHEKWIKSSIQYIRNQDYITTESFGFDPHKILSFLSFQQINVQRDSRILSYRYNYFYNFENENLNMKDIFFNKFKISYIELSQIVFSLWIYSSIEPQMSFNEYINKYIKEDIIDSISFIISDVNQFKEEYEKFKSNNTIMKLAELNFLQKYPIIKYNNKLYCPYLPFLINSITTSLIFELTRDNNNLRSKIGKNVLESYVYHLVLNSKVTNSLKIKKEFVYTKQKVLSADVIIESENNILFIDSKFFNQSLKLRDYDLDEIDKIEDRLSDYIVQIYKQFNDYENNKMNGHLGYNKEYYGIVLIYDEYFSNRETVYNKAIEKLNKIENKKVNLELVKKRILVMSIYSFENILFFSKGNVFDVLKEIFKQNNSHLNYLYPINSSGKVEMSDYRDFNRDQISEEYLKTITKL